VSDPNSLIANKTWGQTPTFIAYIKAYI
jgi:hypothetical protein